jgi:hypothetical protein
MLVSARANMGGMRHCCTSRRADIKSRQENIMYRTLTLLAAVLMVSFCVATPSFAQATRTWVSGVGDDANPCSRTAPCKTFAGAISKTAASGEISVLDPGGFGAVTITKAITLDGRGELASISNSSTNGITVNAGMTDVVIVRNISIDGTGTGLDGVRFIAGGTLVVENVVMSGNVSNSIEMSLASGATASLVVRNSTFTSGNSGVKLTSGTVTATLDNVSIRNTVNGVDAVVGTVEIKNSVIVNNSAFGVLAEGGIIDVDNTLFAGNAVAVQAQAASKVRISNSDLYNNVAGFGCGAGVLASAQNNRKGGDSGGTGTVCAPNATIVLQ